jgi:hypothetical protein
MKVGYLSKYFTAVGAKRLKPVEINPKVSHQHEINGGNPLRPILGKDRKTNFPVDFKWIGENNESIACASSATWYDTREYDPSRSAEFRLFYKENEVMLAAQEGDMFYFAERPDRTYLIIIAPGESTIERQLNWLFGLPETIYDKFKTQNVLESDKSLDITTRFILEELGIVVEESEGAYLDSLLEIAGYNLTFPTTKEFSLFARKTLINKVNPLEEPDTTLMEWMNREEQLFRRLERKIVEQRIKAGFEDKEGIDVEGFISYSLSVQNRRKARAGFAFENHLEALFTAHNLTYSRTAVTENKTKPDFIFPDIMSYRNEMFPASTLTMLGVKTTCKDRWRQVLPEASRIATKHLLTLEPGISENQTNEMQAHNVQLVLPYSIHETFKTSQKSWLFKVSDFIDLTSERQKFAERK